MQGGSMLRTGITCKLLLPPTRKVRTCENVGCGEELCHSYIELCQPTSSRRKQLHARYGFECSCERCQRGLREGGEDLDEAMIAPSVSACPLGCMDASSKLLEQACRTSSHILNHKAHPNPAPRHQLRLLSQPLPLPIHLALAACSTLVRHRHRPLFYPYP